MRLHIAATQEVTIQAGQVHSAFESDDWTSTFIVRGIGTEHILTLSLDEMAYIAAHYNKRVVQARNKRGSK